MKTTSIKKNQIKTKWFLIDAKGKRLGRLASEAAKVLIGKHKRIYCNNLDCGDYLVVINTSKLDIQKKKIENKKYHSHSLYAGGYNPVSLKKKYKEDSNWVVRKAIERMLPKTKLGRQMIKKLYLYKNEKYEQEAQKPELINIESNGKKGQKQ